MTVTGIDDDIGDGDVSFAAIVGGSTSSDANYAGLSVNMSVTTINGVSRLMCFACSWRILLTQGTVQTHL